MSYVSFAHEFAPGDFVTFRQDEFKARYVIIQVMYEVTSQYSGRVSYTVRGFNNRKFITIFEHEIESYIEPKVEPKVEDTKYEVTSDNDIISLDQKLEQ